MIKLIMVLLLLTGQLFSSTEFSVIKEDELELHYDKGLNPYTVEYAMKLLKHTKEYYTQIFNKTNYIPLKIYLYSSTINFISEQNASYWQNFIFQSDSVYINNVDFLLEENSFHIIIKYVMIYNYLLAEYKERIPPWFLNAMALHASNLVFPKSEVTFANFDDMVSNLTNFTLKDEYYQANNKLKQGITDLVNDHQLARVLEFMENCLDYEDFKKKFFQFFGFSLSEYKKTISN
ncbi:MAG: hypothetical protein JW827_08005 [Spirochaetes bacterium]|nr:hypothetical protein [Spirochaetota bacterium]